MALFTRDNPSDPVFAPKPTAFNAPRPIVASARPIDLKSTSEVETFKKRKKTSQWQVEAWDYYDIIGELWSAANLLANVISRIRLYPGYVQDLDMAPQRLDSSPQIPEEVKEIVNDAMFSLEAGTGGSTAILRDFALNFFISGECYLIKDPAKISTGQPETWNIRSVDELITFQSRRGQWAIKPSRDASQDEYTEISPQTHYLARMWRQHPRYSNEADSSVKAILDKAEELMLYDRLARTISRSRLNAGLLYVPDSIAASMGTDGTLPDQEQPDMAPLNDDEADTFEDDLMNGLIAPIDDETSASSVVPIILRGPAGVAEQIKHITFERDMDNMFSNRADRALERLIAGLDLPKEAVNGLANLKYANAIQVEETLYKAHIEPLILSMCDNLSAVFLKPILAQHGVDPKVINRLTMWYDPSAITSKPDRASAASEGFDKKIISASTWRRANGFTESDAPTGEEIIQRLAYDRGMIAEPITDQAIKSIAPEFMDKVQESAAQMNPIMNAEAAEEQGVPADDIIEEEAESAPKPAPTDLIEP